MAKHPLASAVVLAGGASQRLGSDKATLRLGEHTLIEKVVAELRRRFRDVVVVAAPPGKDVRFPPLDARIVRDRIAFQGPVSALSIGMRAARHDIVFACSCDLVMLNADVALALCSMLGDEDAVIPLVGRKLQPLHAAYRRRCAKVLDAMADDGELRLQKVADRLDARIVREKEVRRLDPELRSFFNLNTRRDYASALRMLKLS